MACANTPQKPSSKSLTVLWGLECICGEKPYQNSTSTRLRKQALCRPAKVHTSARLATRPRLASALPACGHLEQPARPPTKPITAQPAPQTLADRKLAKAPLGLQEPRQRNAAPPFFTANKAPCPDPAPGPNGLTAPPQPPQPQERPLTPHSAPATTQHPPDFQSSSLFRLRRRPTRLRRFSQRFHQPKIIRPRCFRFLFSPSARFLPCPTITSAARRVFPEALLATLLRLQTANVAPRRSRVRCTRG